MLHENLRINFGGPLEKISTTPQKNIINFGGVIYLTENINEINVQMDPSGSERRLDFPTNLQSDISTDSIISVSDLLTDDMELLGERALLGLGLVTGELKKSNGTVIVGGKRFGMGSSREQAVWSLIKSGISGVVAESFGPIFQRNASHLGLLTSTNMELATEIQKGRPVKLESFLEEKDNLERWIVIAGGLLPYLKGIDDGKYPKPEISPHSKEERPMNIYEKRLAKACALKSVASNETSLLPIDLAYSYVGLSGIVRASLKEFYGENLQNLELARNKIHLYEDHFALSNNSVIPGLTENQRKFALEELKIPHENYHYGTKKNGGGTGICHRDMLQRIDPRTTQVAIATDSHTPSLGALPILAIPVGSTMLAAALAKGKVPYSTGETTRISFKGKLPPGTSIRDAQLELASRTKYYQGTSVVEFGGTGFNSLNRDEVVALCNMVPEVLNGEIAVTEAYSDGVTDLMDRFGMSEEEALNLYGVPDENCSYKQIFEVDLSETSPWIATPGSPRNGVPLSTIREKIHLDQANFVSCTLGYYDVVELAAVLSDKKIQIPLYITISSKEIRDKADSSGLLNILRAAGAIISDESACSSCIGEGPGSLEAGKKAISASNRNFKGRMGDPSSAVYLGSARLVADSAIRGYIATFEEYRSDNDRVEDNLKRLPHQ